jgi:transposase
VLFDLSGYRVVEGIDRPGELRQVVIESVGREAPCPSCGVLSGRVH